MLTPLPVLIGDASTINQSKTNSLTIGKKKHRELEIKEYDTYHTLEKCKERLYYNGKCNFLHYMPSNRISLNLVIFIMFFQSRHLPVTYMI